MSEKQQKFESYLDEQMMACRRHSGVLAKEGRIDEGNFETIRANIYEIFRTIFSVAVRTCGNNDFAQRDFFLQKAEQIPTSWMVSYKKAEQNGDAKKMHIESIKLDTAQKIKDMFMQIWEETI